MKARGLGEALWGMGIPVQELVMGMFDSGFGILQSSGSRITPNGMGMGGLGLGRVSS